MLALATTTISVLGGSTTDEFGDEVDANTVEQSGIPAQLIEETSITGTSRVVMDPVTGTPKTVRSFICRVTPTLNGSITLAKRIQDDADGAIYAIRNITVPKRAGYSSDMAMNLQEIT